MINQLELETGPLTAADIVRALYEHHSGDYWLCFDELRIGTGYGKDAEQRIDFWAFAAIPSQRFRRVAYEIKVSRADFLAELKQPRKRARALLFSNEFYFIVPQGLIRSNELPPECGLCEVVSNQGDRRSFLNFKHAAPWRDTIGPTWQFLASAVRRAKRQSEAA